MLFMKNPCYFIQVKYIGPAIIRASPIALRRDVSGRELGVVEGRTHRQESALLAFD
jgi:hypothetical protein